MRVVETHPATWRGRTQPETRYQRDLHKIAVDIHRAVTDNLDGLWDRLKRSSHAVYTRVQKARSETQQPSALARVLEEILVLHQNGVPSERLNIYVVETANIIASLDGPGAVTAQRVLEAMHGANVAATHETIAESRLALRSDRALTVGDLQAMREYTRNLIAALQVQLFNIDQFEHRLRTEHPLRVVRGGQA
jgi:predicted nuclease with RNAse H fold